jgi:Flp pilus assembly pilin Flp
MSFISQTSFIRTVVPFLVGAIIAGLTALGTSFDSEVLTELMTVVVGGVYYTVVRWLESRWPNLGWLLGSPNPPTYPNGKN